MNDGMRKGFTTGSCAAAASKAAAYMLLGGEKIENIVIHTPKGIDFDAKSIKFMFDESLPLPKEYVDKQGKECVTQLKGRNL